MITISMKINNGKKSMGTDIIERNKKYFKDIFIKYTAKSNINKLVKSLNNILNKTNSKKRKKNINKAVAELNENEYNLKPFPCPDQWVGCIEYKNNDFKIFNCDCNDESLSIDFESGCNDEIKIFPSG